MQVNAPIMFTCGRCSLQFDGFDSNRSLQMHKRQSPNCFTRHNSSTGVSVETIRVNIEMPFTTRSTPLQPFHKGMISLTARCHSYNDWPLALLKSEKLSPLNMSLAGLFYTGLGDFVKCFSCGITIKSWDLTKDDPLIRHTLEQRQDQGCRFLRAVSSKEDELRLKPKAVITTNIDTKCKICIEEIVQITFLPCKHMTTCESCSILVSKCIICRGQITSYLRVYLS